MNSPGISDKSAHWIGLDIGGANIKLADTAGRGFQQSFRLWNSPDQLAHELEQLLPSLENVDGIAVTMTGELADCFTAKREGILHIVEAASAAAGDRLVHFYGVDGRWYERQQLDCRPESLNLLAASNWHGLARFVSRFSGKTHQLLVDVGSTTVDMIPIRNGQPATGSQTDTDRLAKGELVYCGVKRTPVAMLVSSLPWRGKEAPVARELFATTRDVSLLLGELPEDPSDHETADGGPATRDAARLRMARMVCACPKEVTLTEAEQMAAAVAVRQRELVDSSLQRVIATMESSPETVVVSGEGRFLATEALARHCPSLPVVDLGQELAPPCASAATAFAMATLAAEEVTICP